MRSLLVFGSINLDLVIRVPRLPQPGETLMGGALRLAPGGKGANQAHAAARYGVPVRLAGAVGDDDFAGIALAGLQHGAVDLRAVRRLRGAATGVATIHVADDGENAIVVSPGANEAPCADWIGAQGAADTSVLLLQMEVPAAQSLALARRVKGCGGRVLWNLAPAHGLAGLDTACIDWLVVNRHELQALAASRGLEAPTPEACIERVAAATGCTVIATLGAQGALACTPSGARGTAAALPVAVCDTTGAGDTFCGVLAAAFHEGAGLDDALAHATAAASLACRQHGVQAAQPTRAEIEGAVR
ncbi:MAG TPA: ribokinase [Methylibium sp.]|uniref:ribokinase n=1 Tax=Methylibium sp. TaxID=2067992 RepID=UPI002DBC00BC|nr:ribokinase [Methylibium sp.]HEU4460271.1 ribokinase [Methylibium sp.]